CDSSPVGLTNLNTSKQSYNKFSIKVLITQLTPRKLSSQVPCKILHVPKGSEMKNFLLELAHHFNIVGSPVMLGGESDNSSRAVMGVRLKDPALLIVDPHFYGNKPTVELLLHKGFIRWLPISDLHTDTFYNLCMPCPSL
ncbi:inactive Ufm1-specific protease 1-like, partial [Physella acuta]|uniref:inactive Ufm1-specific protease 1-like n=1 Tax=Physella acuta TaxID=109671 RepID=UPI0027DDBF55